MRWFKFVKRYIVFSFFLILFCFIKYYYLSVGNKWNGNNIIKFFLGYLMLILYFLMEFGWKFMLIVYCFLISSLI